MKTNTIEMTKEEMIQRIKFETLSKWDMLQRAKTYSNVDGSLGKPNVEFLRSRWCVLEELCEVLDIGSTSDFLDEKNNNG